MRDVIENQWGAGLIRSWNEHWLSMVTRIRKKLACLLGADVDEVLIADSTSINLFKLTLACLDAQIEHGELLTDQANFPSDLYILQGLCDRFSTRVTLREVSNDDIDFEDSESRLLANLTHRTKLVVLSHVHYQSGYAYAMDRINQAAERVGAQVIWDVSHSIGAMPIDVRESRCGLMVGCCYKYLNGGPGAPAFLFVKRELQERLKNPIQGWFGAANPFDFSGRYHASGGIEKFAVGTPNILSLAAIEPGIDLTLEAGIHRIRERSLALTTRFIKQVDEFSRDWEVRIGTPRDPVQRGSHVSLVHPNAWQITQALIQHWKVIPDFRSPNIIRFGVTPLYTTEGEIDKASAALKAILLQKSYLDFSPVTRGVT
jgi:kynureninase